MRSSGLGRLSLNQILPALAQCKYSKVAALVSGDRAKALRVARQYGVAETDVYDYQNFERLADNSRVQVVYIVLPNGMHKEFTLRAGKIGKHVLCEKPMANSVADCQAMVDAMKRANRKLMIAYRSQYEPMDRMIAKMVKDKKLGPLREFVAGNSQNVGDPSQWRLNKALAGGGAMPDIGLYCLNAARFLSGEEPQEVVATVYRPNDDPRFQRSGGVRAFHPSISERTHSDMHVELCEPRIALLQASGRARLGGDGSGVWLQRIAHAARYAD